MSLTGAKLALLMTPPFTPAKLFKGGEQGWWFDLENYTQYLFQDSAGTTPVTAVEQPVGKQLDKSGRGNHRIQATAASRPTLSARINILLATATLATQSVTTIAASYKLSFTGTGTVTLSGTSTAGPLVGTGANDRVSLTFTPTDGSLTLTVTGSVTLADLRLSADATSTTPIYQRVTTATDYETSGFRLFLRYDGVDDSLATASTVDFTATDKVTVFAGVTKPVENSNGTILEFGDTSVPTEGELFLRASSGGLTNYQTTLYGASGNASQTPTIAAPDTAVLTLRADMAGNFFSLRRNGADTNPSGTTQTLGGTFKNVTCHFGRRNNTSLPFNGREYSNICVGKLASDTEVARTERWQNIRTGGY